MAEKLVLLDGYSLMYRAYHALSTPMTAPDGTPTNAVHGFLMMLMKVFQEESPDLLGVAFDAHAKTFRADMYPEYKATRKPMPDDLRAQDPVIRELVCLMGIPILELPGYEADDILGTVSRICEETDRLAVLVTGDRDSFQLAGKNTTILYTKRGIAETSRVSPEYIQENYGLSPRQLIDVKGLMGDASDNIPGVPGIGEKTALKLVQECGSLEAVLDTAAERQKGKLRERLLEHRALAELSKRLATIDRNIPMDVDFSGWKVDGLAGAMPRLRELGMVSAAKKLAELAGTAAFVPAMAVSKPEAPDMPTMERMQNASELEARCRSLATTAKWVSVALEGEFALATDQAQLALPFGGDLLNPGVEPEEAMQACRALLEAECDKFLFDVKSLPFPLEQIHGKIFDAKLAAYALNPQRPSFALGQLCEAEGMMDWAEHPAWALHMLSDEYRQRLVRDDCDGVYEEMELPLAYVLRRMEEEGVLVDEGVLRALGNQYRLRIDALVQEIYGLAGEKFNLNSPKQLSEFLFDRMGLPAPKKTRNGYSTDAAVLESLAEEHPVCAKILEYRKYQKLDSTYIQALLRLRDANGRVHTRFDQTATATGRLSSLEPNLQNIPVRTEMGREIRAAFVARPGWMLVDADYSQIELRVLAHMSGDPTMIEAFCRGQDIHARTAAEVAGVPMEAVTPQMRSAAKAVNFGIVYGISDFTLAKNISVSRQEARDFIERYFARYPGVKHYMDRAVETAKEQGYVSTLMNRRRYLPEIHSANYNVRSFGERCAMNSPIQGTAADIIKLAMIRTDAALRRQGLQGRLILQVHDELIVECPAEETEAVCALVRDAMENVMRLDVPLKTDISVGGDWRACK